MFDLRLLTKADATAAHVIQCAAYPAVVCDPVAVYEKGIDLYPHGHIGAFVKDTLAGYFIFKPWYGEYQIENNRHFMPASEADHIFLMDMAIAVAHRGKGLAKQFLEFAYNAGDNLGLTLYRGIAVQGAERIWQHYGFRVAGVKEYGPMIGFIVEKRREHTKDPIDTR